jgi:8-oxo-dGTP pyrophosphatase MutT (NUDIX family)
MLNDRLNLILESVSKVEIVVPIILYKRTFLLGLSTASDYRKDKWCLVSGHVKSYENPYQAAIRECKEETNLQITCSSTTKIDKKAMIIRCDVVGGIKNLKHNNEFRAMGFFDKKSIKSIKITEQTLKNLRDFGIL